MAYKYTTGSVNRGDIYYQDDAQGNTYLDWSEDALGVVVGAAQALVVSSSTVGIGTAAPKYALVIAGDNKRLHMGAIDDVSNYTVDIHLAEDANDYGEMVRGGFIKFDGDYPAASGNGQLQIGVRDGNTTSVNVFRIDRDATANSLCIIDSGLVGIGTTTPASTLDVDGSVAAAITTVDGTSTTVGATHHTILMGSDDSACTVTLPAASGCAGRIYVFKRVASGVVTVKIAVQSGEYIDGDVDAELTFDTQYDIKSVQSDGTQWWIIGEVHMGQ